MNRLRSIWGLRGVAALLLTSLLPVSFAAAFQAAEQTSSYADWLRAQIRGPLDAAVAEALDEAADRPAHSLDAFLAAFVDAYEARQPATPLAQRILSLDLSNEALVAYLESRFNGLVGAAVLPRVAVVAAASPSSHAPDRPVLPLGAWTQHDRQHVRQATSLQQVARPVFVRSVRLLWAAQPRGP